MPAEHQHPRVASILGVHERFYFPLFLCRGLALCPSVLGLARCAFALWGATGDRLRCLALELWLAVLWVRHARAFPPRSVSRSASSLRALPRPSV